MKQTLTLRNALAGLLLLSAAALSLAQGGPGGGQGRGPGGPGGGMRSGGMLIRMTSVQRELKLTQEQIQQINAMRPPQGGPGGGPGGDRQGPPPGGPGGDRQGPPPGGGQRGGGQRGGAEGGPGGQRQDPLAGILNQTQLARLKQLMLQFDAPMTILDPRNGEQLNLTEDQREQIQQIIQQQMPRPERGSEPPAWAEQMRKKAAATRAALAVLSGEQRQTWNQLTGVAFTNWEEPRRPGN